MKEFKSIITHPEGQNLFPGQITAIEGYPHGTSITMKNTKPQIALTPYGASYMMPDMDYKFAGNTVVELPQAQMGGGDPQQDQLMQMIQMYAQMKQMDPKELIQKIQSLPQEQQQQAIQSIAQEVQQAMAQQQQQAGPEQQEAMMGQQDQENPQEQEQEMGQGMMSHGGEHYIDYFNNYNPSPQAQDLNWYYKATGGEAFPQANTYPEDWASYSGNQYAQGGEAFPQAQTYLPYMRKGETRPNFMFQKGGQSDIDNIYQIMKKGGMDLNPRKKKGGKFDHLKAFNKYLQIGGGKLPYKDINEAEDNYDQMMGESEREDIEPMQSNAYSNMKSNAYFDTLKNTTLDNYWDQPTSNNEKPELTGPVYDTEDMTDIMASPSRSYDDESAQLESDSNDLKKMQDDAESAKISGPNKRFKGDRDSSTLANFNKSGDGTKPKNPKLSWDSPQKNTQAGMLNGAAAMTGNSGLFGAVAAVNNIGRAVKAADAGWSHPRRAFGNSMMEDGGMIDENQLTDSMSELNGPPRKKRKHRRKPMCIDGRCYEFQEGGTNIYTSPNIDNSHFNPMSGDIYLNEDQSHYPDVLPHELDHYNQWLNGAFSVNPDTYFDDLRKQKQLPENFHEGQFSDNLNYNIPLKMPSIAEREENQNNFTFYNRRPVEEEALTNDFLFHNPSFNLVDPELMYEKKINPLMYEKPWTLEGEAQRVGDRYIGPTMQRGMQRGGRLPKHQAWLSQTGNLSQPQGAFNTWNVQTPANIENSSGFQAIQSANQNATKIADQNVIKQGTDQMGDKPQNNLNTNTGVPDFALGDSLIAGMGQAADYLGNFKRKMDPNKDRERRNTHTSEFMDVAQFGGGQYGDWSTNATQGTSFRPDEMVYAQKAGRPYKDISIYDYPTYDFKDMFSNSQTMQSGGNVLDSYDEEGEYDLTQEEIDEIIAAGGTIEYL